jgi:hypothetical protein
MLLELIQQRPLLGSRYAALLRQASNRHRQAWLWANKSDLFS